MNKAEYTKIIKGNLSLINEEKFKVELPCGAHKIITSNFLQGIIKPRYEEIIEMCRNILEEKILFQNRNGYNCFFRVVALK